LHPDFIIHLKKNLTAMVNLLQGHVIPLTYYSAGLPDSLDVKTVYGNTLHVTNTDGNGVWSFCQTQRFNNYWKIWFKV